MKSRNKATVYLAIVFVLVLIGSGTMAFADRRMTAGPQDRCPGYAGNLSDEDLQAVQQERQKFFDETKDLRQEMHQKQLELKSELAKKNPDAQKAAALQKDISVLGQEFDQKRLDQMLKMKKINPDIGRMGGWGRENKGDDDDDCPNYGRHMGRGYGAGMRGSGMMGPGMMNDDDGDWNCPNSGRSMGPGRGYGMMGGGAGMGTGMMGRGSGMGPGMMGGGYGMGPGYGRGPGAMRGAPAQGDIGPGAGRLETPLNEDGARKAVENYLQSTRNPNLKLGKVTEKGDAFEADIVTKDGSLVDKLLVDKSTGWMHPANQ
ncbi:MAG: periplasmic heavy metal sensor [Desulfobacterales bacterium]